jgi:hypothetical protein
LNTWLLLVVEVVLMVKAQAITPVVVAVGPVGLERAQA